MALKLSRRNIVFKPLAEVQPAVRNPKAHDLAALITSIKRFGFADAVVLDERTGRLVSGHGRVDALHALRKEGAAPPDGVMVIDGEWHVPVQMGWASKDDTEAEAFIIAANRLVEVGGWDDAALASVLGDLAKAGALDAVGFDDDDVQRIIAEASAAEFRPNADVDAEPERAPAVVQPGDVWLLGRHRMMCGDSTSRADVRTLVGGASVDLVLTDPPYGLGANASTKKNNYEGFSDTREHLQSLIEKFLPIARDTAPLVALTPGTKNLWLYPEPTWVLAWHTPTSNGRGPWGFTSWQPILCYGKDPMLANGLGSHPDFVKGPPSVDSFKSIHPCPKPVASWARIMERVSLSGQTLLDLFGGTGTSIITAEQEGRTALIMEMLPAYCDVVLARWESVTGKRASKA